MQSIAYRAYSQAVPTLNFGQGAQQTNYASLSNPRPRGLDLLNLDLFGPIYSAFAQKKAGAPYGEARLGQLNVLPKELMGQTITWHKQIEQNGERIRVPGVRATGRVTGVMETTYSALNEQHAKLIGYDNLSTLKSELELAYGKNIHPDYPVVLLTATKS